MEEELKTCPYCAEDIKKEAIKCKHCGEVLDKEASETYVAPPGWEGTAPKGTPNAPKEVNLVFRVIWITLLVIFIWVVVQLGACAAFIASLG